jgi:hypothetical protein
MSAWSLLGLPVLVALAAALTVSIRRRRAGPGTPTPADPIAGPGSDPAARPSRGNWVTDWGQDEVRDLVHGARGRRWKWDRRG